MTAVWILSALIAVLLIVGYGCMLFAMRRGKSFDIRDPKAIAKSAWAKFQEPVLEGAAWIVSQESEGITIRSFDGLRLAGRLIPAEDPKGTILAFHGYRSMACIDFSAAAKYYHELGFNLLLIDQRAHGHSEGKYLTYGVLERRDCQSWAEYSYQRFGDGHPLYLDGVSMGASTVLMAADLPMPPTVRGIIADCGFTSPWEIIAHVMKAKYHLPPFPFLYLIDLYARLLAHYSLKECSTTDTLSRTRLPVLMVHGTEDHFVPCEMSKRAYEACSSKKQLILVEGASHGASFIVDGDRCRAALREFLLPTDA